jgi:hypothetical protein
MLPYECSWAFEEEFKRKHGRNPELLIVGNPPKWERKLGVPERHQLRIARDTLKMHDAMVGVMGGPTKAEAREIIRRYESRCGRNPGGRRCSIGKNPELLIIGNPPRRRFKVIEHMDGYAVYDTVSGKDHWMSDGVDAVFTRSGRAMSPGTAGFIEAWERDLNSSPSETAEAYGFPSENPRRRTAMRKRRRSRNSWKGHKVAHRKAALKGWRKRSRKGRKKYAKSGKKFIRFGGQKVSWKGLVRRKGVKGAVKIWRKSRKIGGRR